jgi:isoleucyl-tRNA synthetase
LICRKYGKLILTEMQAARDIVEASHALRATANLKVRQPLASLEITANLSQAYLDLLADELNVEQVKTVTEVSTASGWLQQEVNNLKISLDSNLSDDLKDKGILRELIRSINALRKESGLQPSDRPTETYQTNSETLLRVIAKYKTELIKNTSAADLIAITDSESLTQKQSCEINGEQIILGLK